MTASDLGCETGMVRPPEMPSARVEADLRRRIAAGEWQPGQQLPTVTVLAAEYHVGKGTVSRVLRALEADGLVTITARWGTHLV